MKKIAIIIILAISVFLGSVASADKVTYVNSIGDVVCVTRDNGCVDCYHRGMLLEDVTPKEASFFRKAWNQSYDWFVENVFFRYLADIGRPENQKK